MTVDFATYCCEKDMDKLHDNFNTHVESHNYKFDNLHLIYQRCLPEERHGVFPVISELNINAHSIFSNMYTDILSSNGINPDNEEADELTHGWNHSHYWKHHCVNHLVAMEKSSADYIVLCDADCYIRNQRPETSWINEGIRILQQNKDALLVSPSDGSGQKKTQTMSQQIFITERKRLQSIDFDLPFTGFKDGGPMQEYYFMLEGRIGRYMEKHNLYRYILNDNFRYWHKAWH